MNTKPTCSRVPSAARFTVLLSLAIILTAAGGARADDKKPKPQPAVSENVSLNFGQIKTEYSNGAPGPSVSVTGVLHLVSQSRLSADGTPVAFTLHANVSDTDATSADGTPFVAVGAEAIPAECESTPCSPSFWTLTFRLVPESANMQSSLFFALTIHTDYDAMGGLTDACVVGQVDCEEFPGAPGAPSLR